MNGKSRLALTAFASLPLVCATVAGATPEPAASWAISHAPTVSYGSFPAFVQVVIEFPDSDNMTYCSGTLLAKDAVLTSAECLRDTTNGVNVPYKTWPLERLTVHHPENGERMSVTAVHYPKPEAAFPFNPADLAVLKLYAPLETDARVTIPTQGLPMLRQGQGTVFGSGAKGTESDEDVLAIDAAKLRKASAPLHQPGVCTDNPHLSYMLCAEANFGVPDAPHTCANDEGSPLMMFGDTPDQAIQVGLAGSAQRMVGDAALCEEGPVLYTNLTAYSDWIASVVPTVSRKPYGEAGPYKPNNPNTPNNPGNPSNPSQPATPAPDADQALSCGNVREVGSKLPGGFADGMAWQPPRGPKAGSEVSLGASQLTWGRINAEPPKYAVLAGECAWADALPANALTQEGPLLLTDSKTLEPEIAREIDRLNVREVVIIGGPKAVSPAVERALVDSGKRVRRIQGETRLETAVAVTNAAIQGHQDIRVFLARAYPSAGGSPSQAFADSLGAAFGVTWESMPVLLTEQNKLSTPTAQWVTAHDPSEVWLMGGQAALGQPVENALKTNGEFPRTLTRFAGDSRTQTAAKLATELLNRPDNNKPKGVMILDSQGDDAWKTGFVFGGPAYHGRFVYGLAAGDVLPEETKQLIRMSRKRGLNVYCVASARACLEVADTR